MEGTRGGREGREVGGGGGGVAAPAPGGCSRRKRPEHLSYLRGRCAPGRPPRAPGWRAWLLLPAPLACRRVCRRVVPDRRGMMVAGGVWDSLNHRASSRHEVDKPLQTDFQGRPPAPDKRKLSDYEITPIAPSAYICTCKQSNCATIKRLAPRPNVGLTLYSANHNSCLSIAELPSLSSDRLHSSFCFAFA